MSKRIAFFHEYFPKGGAERVTNDLAHFFHEKGYEIYLITRKFYPDKIADHNDFNTTFKTLILPGERRTNSKINTDFIINSLNETKIDYLIIQGFFLKDISYIKKQLESTKIIYCNHGMPFWEITDKIDRKKEKAKMSILNTISYYLFDFHKIYTFRTYHRRYIKQYKDLYTQADAFVNLCEDYSVQVKNVLKLKDSRKLFAINNSEKIVKDIVLEKQNNIIFVGRLSYADKRVDRLLDIWKSIQDKVSNWKLTIIGDGPERNNLENIAKQLNLKNIEFAGFKSNTKPYYDSASILCLTSTFEGWGLALTEAQANGVIPIAFGCSGGVIDILKPDGINGIIVKPFDIEEYSNKLLDLINNKDKRKYIQKNIIEKAKEYSPEIIGQKWIDLFKTIDNLK